MQKDYEYKQKVESQETKLEGKNSPFTLLTSFRSYPFFISFFISFFLSLYQIVMSQALPLYKMTFAVKFGIFLSIIFIYNRKVRVYVSFQSRLFASRIRRREQAAGPLCSLPS